MPGAKIVTSLAGIEPTRVELTPKVGPTWPETACPKVGGLKFGRSHAELGPELMEAAWQSPAAKRARSKRTRSRVCERAHAVEGSFALQDEDPIL